MASRNPATTPVERSASPCDIALIGFEDQENLGMRAVAAYLAQNGVSVRIISCQDTSAEAILSKLISARPRIVGFSLIFQRMLPRFANLIQYLRNNGISAHFTMGGHFPTLEYEGVLSYIPALDTIVRHEGERTLLELLEHVDDPQSWDSVAGIAFRRDGRIVATRARSLIRDLDSLPFVLRSDKVALHRGIGLCSIAGSRGCYYDCSFCSIQEFYRQPAGPKRRSRSPAHVALEMEHLYKNLGVRIFIFQDDDLYMKGGPYRHWVTTFLNELKRRNLAGEILWRISCRIDDVDAEMLLKMREAGLVGVYLGIESGSDQGLETFNKHYHVEDVYHALAILRDIEIPYEYGFMIFEPYSTTDTVRANVEFLKELDSYGSALANFCKMAPYAGTPIARRLSAEDRLEGTLDSPDYRFLDSRLDLLQLFVTQTFNFRNFSNQGLVERLRFAKFDCAVLDKFYAHSYDTHRYAKTVRSLIADCNRTALEALSLATALVESRTHEETVALWPLLRKWQQDEWEAEARITRELDLVQQEYGLIAGLPQPGLSLSQETLVPSYA